MITFLCFVEAFVCVMLAAVFVGLFLLVYYIIEYFFCPEKAGVFQYLRAQRRLFLS